MSDRSRGVSPVVGGVLIVAIVILLSAVTAGMILDLDEEREPAPEVAFSLEADETVAGDYWLVHRTGERLDGDKVEVLGIEDPDTLNGAEMTAGDRHKVVPTEETITIVYHGDHGTSYTLRELSVDPAGSSTDSSDSSTGSSGPTLPSANKGCSWVEDKSDNGTEDVKVDDHVVDCDVETDKIVEVLNGGAVIGDTESQTNEIDVDDSTLYGDATAQKVVNVQDGAVYGSVLSRTADVKIDNSFVNESIEGEKVVEVINGGTVEGDAVSADEVKVLSGSTVEGDVISKNSAQVKLTDATVKGDVYTNGTFDCTNSTINGQSCDPYTPKDPNNY